MKRIIATLALLALTASAIASCPPYAPYRCVPGMNGKLICSCG